MKITIHSKLSSLGFLIIVLTSCVFPQTQITGNLTTYVDNFISGLPSTYGGNEYKAPSSANLSTWAGVVENILQGNYSTANTSAAGIGYRVVEYTDNSVSPGKKYYILEKKSTSTNYWGMFIYNPGALRKRLFIQSPHPKFDSYTGKQGLYIFRNLSCRAFFLSGAHRCNSSTASVCDGTSTICTDLNDPYKISDQAHTVTGTLQKSTEVLNANIANLFVVQPHGFSQSSGDPDVIMSNGTRDTPEPDYLVTLRDNLLVQDDTLTFKIIHINQTWTKLAATENTQGRLINGSADPCSEGSSVASGRFLHIEQTYNLRDTDARRKKLSDALALTFPVDALTLLAPAGNQIITAGSNFTITWSSAGLVSQVKLEYSTDNGKLWNTIIPATPNNGSYTWSVPYIGAWRCRVRVLDVDYSTIGDTCNTMFKIKHAVFPTTGLTIFVDQAAAFGPRKLNGIYDFHRGIDFPGSYNVPIHPALPGVIVRMEDSSVTAGTGLQRNGNWILVKIDSASGQARHNAYLHLNKFHTYTVGDTVTTLDTIGFMGKSGYEINTVHLHLELYKSLIGTAIDKDKANNPIELLPYNNANSYPVAFLNSNDSSGVQISVPDTELDFDAITLYGSIASRTVGFNARTGIDPVNNDNQSYNNVRIDPDPFIQDSSVQRIRFWTKNSEIGLIDSVKITDVNGYTSTISQASLGPRYAVTTGNFSSAIWAATPVGLPGSASVPLSFNDITINAGVTVTINNSLAECKSVYFGGNTSKLSFSAGSVLNVYGDFTLASTTHNAITSWAAGAKIRFTGSASTQTLGGWSTSAFSTGFDEIVVDKSSGKVVTNATNMRFQIGTNLEILSGTFELAATDDIEGRNYAGTASSPTIVVRAGGVLNMAGGASHIRRASNTGEETSKIGSLTVFGTANLASSSSNRMNFAGISIESGGIVEFPTGRNTSANTFNPGIITVKSGGLFKNSLSVTSFWFNNTTVPPSVVVNSGGEYEAAASSTTIPQGGISQNSGSSFRFSSELSTTLPSEISSYKTLILSGSGSKTLSANINIEEVLQLSGSFNTLNVGGSVLSYGASATLRYGYSGQNAPQITSNAEWPELNGPPNIEICNSAGVTLHAERTISGSLYLNKGLLILGDNNLYLGTNSTITGTPGISNMVVPNGEGRITKLLNNALSFPYSFTFPIGDTSGITEYSPVSITVKAGILLSAAIQAGVVNSKHPQNNSPSNFIDRYWDVSSTGITALTADIVAVYSSADVHGAEADLIGAVYRGSNGWTRMPEVNTNAHLISGIDLNALGEFTAGEYAAFAPNTSLTISFIPEGYLTSGVLSITDRFTIVAVSASPPGYTDFTSGMVEIDSITYIGTVTFPSVLNGQFYIYVKGRSVLETWSANPILFQPDESAIYNFTSDQSKAFGGNMVLKDGKYCLYSGDVNQDGIIDFSDLLLVDNDYYLNGAGYKATDVTGNLIVDFEDLQLVDNNARNFIQSVTPRSGVGK